MVVYSSISAQEEQGKTIKKFHVSDIFIKGGSNFDDGPINSISATGLRALAPNSVLLNNNFDGYKSSSNFSNNGTEVSIMLGIRFRDKQKTNYKTSPLLRLGVSYYSAITSVGELYKEDRKRYDTITSTKTGQSYYLDSGTTNRYFFNYRSNQIRLDGSLIFRTHPEERWSLYSGIGITTNFSVQANTEINYNKSSGTKIVDSLGHSSSNYYYLKAEKTETEKHRNKMNFGASTFIPIGIDFRVGKKNEFLKRTHLFYEFRLGINLTSIPELGIMTTVSKQHSFGLRISLQ